MKRATALLCAFAAIATAGAACAQSSPAREGAPAAGSSASASSQAAWTSSWNAPEPWRTDRFFLATSLYTRHFNYDPAHNDHQDMILGEWNFTEQWLVGAAIFKNSFAQPSQYVYGAYRFRPLERLQPLYVKVSAGLVHGYTGEYQGKIPYNGEGIAPVIVPSLGYCLNRFCAEFVLFGAAGALITMGITIP